MRIISFYCGLRASEPLTQILVAMDSLFVSAVGELQGLYGKLERFLVAVGSHVLFLSKTRNAVLFPPGVYEYRS